MNVCCRQSQAHHQSLTKLLKNNLADIPKLNFIQGKAADDTAGKGGEDH